MGLPTRGASILVAAFIVAFLATAAAPASAATYTVTSAAEGGDTDSGDGLCKASLGQCTLRAAIEVANASAASDTIAFNIPGSGVHTISPSSKLPDITSAVVLDGTSQPGWAANAPKIELNGAGAGAGDGLKITAGSSTVRGLIINRFARDGVFLTGGGDNRLQGNFIGTDSTGELDRGNAADGIEVYRSANNIIGGFDPAQRNVVSGNGNGSETAGGSGVAIFGKDTSGNIVQGNFVGTDKDGTSRVPNHARGVFVTAELPLDVAAADTAIVDNLVSGNDSSGIRVIDGPRTTITGNTVGLGTDGEPVKNGVNGVDVDNAPELVIGGSAVADRNLISGNGRAGVSLKGSKVGGADIAGNFIGTDKTGETTSAPSSAPLGNLFGVELTSNGYDGTGATGVDVGTAGGAGNVISGNERGVFLSAQAKSNYLEGNLIGTDKDGTDDLGNNLDGVLLNSSENVVGGPAAGHRNVISGNGTRGVRISGAPATDNKIVGNYIGLEKDGIGAMPNSDDGVSIGSSAAKNIIGFDRNATPGTAAANCTDACNRIVDNAGAGVAIEDTSAANTVRGNRITGNLELGIDLGPTGPTPNDAGDGDSGANDRLNFPVGVTAYTDPAKNKATVSGVIDAPDPGSLKVDIYGELTGPGTPDPSGFGEGRVFIDTVTPEANGTFSIEAQGADFYSATATDTKGNTSEFSPVCGDPDGNGSTDNDADGLCDDWETKGIDFNGDKSADLALQSPPFGADPNRKDVFVEVDYMDAFFHSHKPELAALQDVETAFSQAPVDAGSGVRLHLSPGAANRVDEALPDVPELWSEGRQPGAEDDFVDLKHGDTAVRCDGHFGTPTERSAANCVDILGAKGIAFRYAIFGHTFKEAPLSVGSGDYFGDDLLVTLGDRSDDALKEEGGGIGHCLTLANCKRYVEAGAFMHELGHTLGLSHGGNDHNNYEPNYLSVMNYTFQAQDHVPGRKLDYSRWELKELKEAKLKEEKGIDDDAPPADLATRWPQTAFTFYDAGKDTCNWQLADSVGDIDWDLDGPEPPGFETQIAINDPDDISDPNGIEGCQDPDNAKETLTGFDDWANLHYSFRDTQGFARGAGLAPVTERERTSADVAAAASHTDADDDGFSNADDNCPAVVNPDQADADGDEIGDACDPEPSGGGSGGGGSGGGGSGGGGSGGGGGIGEFPVRDLAPPRIFLIAAARAKLARVTARGLGIQVACSEDCRLRADLLLDRRSARRLRLAAVRGPVVVGRANGRVVGASKTRMTVKLGAKAKRRFRRLRAVRLTLSVKATDAAGNFATVRRRVALRR